MAEQPKRPSFLARLFGVRNLVYLIQGGGGDDDTVAVSSLPTAGQAQAVAAVFACVSHITDALCAAPVSVWRAHREAAGTWYEPVDHPLNTLLVEPAREWTGLLMRSAMYTSLVRDGNAYAIITRDGSGRPVELVPAWGTPSWTEDGGRTYQLTPFGWNEQRAKTGTYAAADVLAVHGPMYDGLTSPSAIAAAAQAAGLYRAAVRHQRSVTEEGIHGHAAFELSDELSGMTLEQQKEFQSTVFASVKAALKRRLIPLLPAGIKSATLGKPNSVDLSIIEALRWTVVDVARAFRFPPGLLGEPTLSKAQSITEMFEQMRRLACAPHAERMDAAATARLLDDGEREDGLVVRTPLAAVGRGTWGEQIRIAGEAASNWSLVLPNEARAWLGMGPVEGGETLRESRGNPATPGREGAAPGETDDEEGEDGA